MAEQGNNQQSQQGQQQGGQDQQQGQGETLDFETWLGRQDDTVKGLIDGHTKGLKSALESERTQRKDFERQLREAAGKLEKGSEAEQRVTKLADDLGTATRRADFYEVASAAGCTNLKLAWLAVSQDADLMDSRGNVRMEALKQAFPELFKATQQPAARGNAGSGAGQGGTPTASMNDFIRRAAGR
jgi:hypothetical protein